MNAVKEPNQVNDDMVVSLDYVLTVDGEEVDSTRQEGPIEFLQGRQEIIPGLERSLYGMAVGENKSVMIPAEQAYGEVDPQAVLDVPRADFPEGFPIEPGVELEVRDRQGQTLVGTIVSVGEESVKIDFNHPLAGKDLAFEVTIAGLRTPTDEELAHGHAHGGDEHP